MKACLKNRKGKSAYIKIFSELPLTDKEVCRCYVRLNTTSYYDHTLILIHGLLIHLISCSRRNIIKTIFLIKFQENFEKMYSCPWTFT